MGIVNTGPACTVAIDTPAMEAAFQGVCRWVREKFAVDMLELGIPMSSWYSKCLNVVLTCEEFFEGPKSEKQKEMFGQAPFECVGTLVDPNKTHRAIVEDFPLESIKALRQSGKKCVLLSLGTAVTSLMWERPCPLTQDNDDGTQLDGQTLAQMKGKDVAHFIWQAAFHALGGVEELFVVMATGEQDDALDNLKLPANFRAFKTIPQLELLPLCSAFITHGGMGSTMESFVCGVPLITIPIFGDQIANAENTANANLGISFRYPLRTLTSEALRHAVQTVAQTDTANLYRTSVEHFAKKTKAFGGASKAVDCIVSVVKR